MPGKRPLHRDRTPPAGSLPAVLAVAAPPGADDRRARHRARPLHRLPGPAALAPAAALAVLVVLALRTVAGAVVPAEGTLATDGFSLTGTGAGLPEAALSPEWLGALHMALYATLTRAFDRHDSLLAAGRELVVVATLAAALLVWRTARRLGLDDAAAAVAVLLFGVPALLPPAGLVDSPARLAVPWLLVAAWSLAPGRPTPTARAVAGVATVVAVLLAPDVALLVLAGVATALVTGGLLPAAGRRVRSAAAGTAIALFAVVAVLLGRWQPGAATASAWGVPVGLAAAAACACAVVGGLAAWRLPRLRPAGVAVAVTAAAALVPPVRLTALIVVQPGAALLAAALLEPWSRPARRPLLRPAVAAAAALVAAVVAIALVPSGGPSPDGRAPRALLAWARDQLPDDARLVAPRPVWARLVHAGADEGMVRLRGTAEAGSGGPVFAVGTGAPAPGAVVLARFDSPGSVRPLLVTAPSPAAPTSEALERRGSLSRAVLANPTTTAGARAAAVLSSGAVDARLLAVLAALAAREGIGIADLPPARGEPAPSAGGVLARHARLDSLGGEPLTPGTAATDRLLAWLDAQQPPFAPDAVRVRNDGVLIGFRYAPDPDTLVARTGP